MSSQVSSNIRAIIGRNLKAARARKGLTQRQLAVLIDVPEMHISKWERGKHRPEDETLFALARALDMTYVDFYVDPEPEQAAA